jgi:hypothetical protein
MGHWRQLDFRYSWLREALHALDAGLQRINSSDSDGMHQAEHTEELLGLAFVAIQAYMASSMSDLGAAFPHIKIGRADFLAQHSVSVGGVSCAEVLWHMGNYYKHHDEWEDWQPVGPRSETVRVLDRIGVTQETELPCRKALVLLLGDKIELASLLESTSVWRDEWFRDLSGREPRNDG